MPVRLAMLMRKGIDIYFFMFGFNIHEVSYHKLYDEYSIHSTVKINFISLSKIAF